MNFILLLLCSLFSAFSLGYIKFFALSYFCDHHYPVQDKDWVVQLVGAVLTIGPLLIFPLAAPMANAFKKRKVMSMSLLLCLTITSLGAISNWEASLWTYITLFGISIGNFSMSKMSCVELQAKQQNVKTDTVNAGMTITFLVGMLSGIVASTWAYKNVQELSHWVPSISLFLALLSSYFLKFKNEKLISYKKSQRDLIKQSMYLLKKFPHHCFMTSLLWGVAGALSLAVTASVEIAEIATEVEASFVSLAAAIGIILGNVISVKFNAHKEPLIKTSIVMMCLGSLFIPNSISWLETLSFSITLQYYSILLEMVFMGMFFGISTNLVDSDFLHKTSLKNLGTNAAALQSCLISLSSLVIGTGLAMCLMTDIISIDSQYSILSLLLFLTLLSSYGFLKKRESKIWVRVLCHFVKIVMALRYKVKVKGVEVLKEKKKSILFLPNHPAEIDPVLLTTELYRTHAVRPVVTSSFYHMKGIQWIMKAVRSFSMPDLEKGSDRYKQYKVKECLETVAASLRNGDNVLLYPAGQLSRDGFEKCRGKSGVPRILKSAPETEVVLVKTTGLWGSSFSTAQHHGKTPELFAVMKEAVKALFLNAFLFMPKREITIEFESFKVNDVEKVNTEIEEKFNTSSVHVLNHVQKVFWKKDKELILENQNVVDVIKVEDTLKIREAFSKEFEIPIEECIDEKRLTEDLGFDSLTKAEIVSWIEDKYRINNLELEKMTTVGALIQQCYQKNTRDLNEKKTDLKKNTIKPVMSEGATLSECFINTVRKFNDQIACGDERSGELSYQSVLLKATVLSKRFKGIPEKHVGMMLPASSATAVTFLALQLAGKVVVMLNWTVGKRNLLSAIEDSKINTIISSQAFLKKINDPELDCIFEKTLCLEDVAEEITLSDKLKSLVQTKFYMITGQDCIRSVQSVEDETAVILFTSGSESKPKGVPLSHKNIMSNIESVFEKMNFEAEDTLYGILPSFHSFGLTITTLLPLLTGVKVFFHPNPLESQKIAEGIESYEITHLCATPTFLKNILNQSNSTMLKTMKLFICGAEKCSEAVKLLSKEKASQSKIIEGYGITECSPVISMQNPTKENKGGVGEPIPCVGLKIVHPESHEELLGGDEGLILVSGPSIFNEYLNSDNDPFLIINNKKWYNTGDIGKMNDEGELILSGRMKRFVKIAGEMISLPALEDSLKNKLSGYEDLQISLHADESGEKRASIHCISNKNFNKKELNQIIKEAGFSNLAKIQSCFEVESLPLLGSGKVDYGALKALYEAKCIAA